MKSSLSVTLKAQVDILAAVMQEVLRALNPDQAKAVALAVQKKLATSGNKSEAADEARVEILVPLLDALTSKSKRAIGGPIRKQDEYFLLSPGEATSGSC